MVSKFPLKLKIKDKFFIRCLNQNWVWCSGFGCFSKRAAICFCLGGHLITGWVQGSVSDGTSRLETLGVS